MSDMGDDFRAYREAKREYRNKHARDCEGCIQHHPKRSPTKLLPAQKCGWCGYIDPRPRQS